MNYKEILQNVLNNGQPKQPVRIENGKPVDVEQSTITSFAEIFRHDMSEGFPLTTLRPIPFRSLCVELEGFIQGVTDKTWYQERKCKFWDEWASNTAIINQAVEEGFYRDAPIGGWSSKIDPKEYAKTVPDLGPIYGFQWRCFGQVYFENDIYKEDHSVNVGADQLKTIVNTLKNNPYDRRMVCSAWNPNQLLAMALPPCHYAWNVVVIDDTLNLIWHQRSADLILGIPSNIASYAMLLLLLAREGGLKPGQLVGTFADCHIYSNQIEQTKQLLEREERAAPTVELADGDIFSWTHRDVKLNDYNPHSKITMGDVVV